MLFRHPFWKDVEPRQLLHGNNEEQNIYIYEGLGGVPILLLNGDLADFVVALLRYIDISGLIDSDAIGV